MSAKIGSNNQTLLFTLTREESGERETARLMSLTLPHAGSCLNCPPIPALGLNLRPTEFAVAVKFRLSMAVFGRAGACPACTKESDVLGDHALLCGSGGKRIDRHNHVRDALYQVAQEAGLSPAGRGTPSFRAPRGDQRRPADLLIPRWAVSLDAALDVTVTQCPAMPSPSGRPRHIGRHLAPARENCQNSEFRSDIS